VGAGFAQFDMRKETVGAGCVNTKERDPLQARIHQHDQQTPGETMESEPHITRRTALAAGTAAALGALPAAAQTTDGPPPDRPIRTPTSDRIPVRTPSLEFIYEAVVDVGEVEDLGPGPLGGRRMVPITGGSFEGPRLRGTVVPGGLDRQLVRADGVRLLDAFYEMRTDDGAVITVRNHVTAIPDQSRFSYLEITAPEGPYGWLNDRVFVGTLDSLRPDRAAVAIRVFALA
jgi:hypothetical protein